MPLYAHSGIVRNLFAPLLSGGSVIFCPGFDAGVFVTTLETMKVGTADICGRVLRTLYCIPRGHQSPTPLIFNAVMTGGPLATSAYHCLPLLPLCMPPAPWPTSGYPQPSWYYAAPTMHHLILQEMRQRFPHQHSLQLR